MDISSSSTGIEKKLESKLRKAFFTYQMADNAKIAVALSGGKDSLTLLHLLHKIRGKGLPFFSLLAVHVSGTNSCGASVATEHLKAFCKTRDIPLRIRTTTEIPQSCYPCSRNRRKALFSLAKEEGFSTIAFGHHYHDSVETLLLNVLHKAEFEPLMPNIFLEDYHMRILRPLIFIKETEIITFAKQQGFFRITCGCPIGQKSKRAEVKKLLPVLEEIFPSASSNLFQAGYAYAKNKALLKTQEIGNVH